MNETVMIEIIESLLKHLYPDTPPIDILTRHRAKPLISHAQEPQAMAAIAQSQRINRDNDYDCSGLCEFHIGLIYMGWRDFSGAGQQFALARRQWRFVNRQTAVCLTHFAEGCTLEANFAYEAALIAYKRVSHYLLQLPESSFTDKRVLHYLLQLPESSFTDALRPELTSAQNRTRQQLVNLSSPPQSQPTQSEQQTESSTPASNSDVPIPRDNMHQPDPQMDTPPPQDNMHQKDDGD